MVSLRLMRLVVSMLAVVTLILAGCGQPQAISNEDGAVQIALQPLTDEEKLVVILTDTDGTPITDAMVEVEGNMNHAGMIPVLADPVADDADGRADGHYTLPFAFTMLGDWIITVKVDRADGSNFERNLEVRASGQGVVGDSIVDSAVGNSAANDNVAAADADSHASHEDEADHSHDHDAEQSNDHGDAHDDAHGDGPVMEVHHPMARPAPLAGGTGAVYFLLHNHGNAPATLIGGASPASAAVELHTTINDNGVMRMRQITDGIEVNPGDEVVFEPGGMHVMLVDLVAPLDEGDTIELTLKFDGADDLVIEVPVTNIDGEGEESAGHSH